MYSIDLCAAKAKTILLFLYGKQISESVHTDPNGLSSAESQPPSILRDRGPALGHSEDLTESSVGGSTKDARVDSYIFHIRKPR